MSVRLAVLVLLAALSACALQVPTQPFVPLQSAGLEPQRISYLLSWQQQQRSRQLMLVLEHTPDSVQLVGLNSSGMTLFQLQRSPYGDQLQTGYFDDQGIDPQQWLNILLVLNYAPDDLQQSLDPGWQLLTEGRHRQWFYQDQLLGSAFFDKDKKGLEIIHLTLAGEDYQLRILQQETLTP